MTQSPQHFLKQYEQASNTHEVDAVLALVAEDAVYLFSDESVHMGKEAIGGVLRRNFELIQDETYALENVTWLVEAESAAACVYDYTWSGVIHGKPAAGYGWGTTVLRRAGSNH